MIDILLTSGLEVAGKAVVKGATALGKAVVEHFTKHGTKYLIGGGAAAGGAAAGGAVAYAVGHSKGKKEGAVEQAKRDEIKIQKIEESHKRDRQEWERIDKEKDELLGI